MYASGNNSVRSTGALRTLQSWAADDLSGEPFAAPFVAAFGPSYLDAWIVGLTNGTDMELKAPAERAAALGAALQGPVQSAYFMHEVDEALAKVRAGDAAGRDAATGAPHNLDEAWGIWAGRGDGGACTLSGLAARAAEGDADAAVLAAMEDAYAASLSGDAAALERARETLVREAVVAPQTRLLLAGAEAIDAAAAAGEPTAALQAETAAHFRSIWPLVGADSPAARAVLEALNVGGAPAEGVAAAVRAAAPEWADSAVAAAAAAADAPATSAAPAPMAGAPASAAAVRALAPAAAAAAFASAAALAAL
jgi:hypothetical protein